MFKFLKIWFEVTICLVVLTAISFLVLWKTEGMRFYSVQTASMSPLLKPGDLIIAVRPQPASLQIGDIVSYSSSQDPQKTITHRIYQTEFNKGYVVTKGDNLLYADPPVAYSSIKSKAYKALPKLGYGLDFLHKPAGLITAVYFPSLLICAYEIHRLAVRFSYGRYRFSSGM